MKVEIEIDGESFEGEFVERMNPDTVEALKNFMPLEGTLRKWGKELYFRVPIDVGIESPKRYVKKGDIGYWPEGQSLCIFYGRTPGSPSDEKIKPASPVNVVGSIENPERLEKFSSGVSVRIIETEQ